MFWVCLFNYIGSSSSSEEGGLVLSDTDSDFSDEEESVTMLTCPQHQQPRSISSASIGADVISICSQNQSENIRITADAAVNKVTDEVRGCLIHRCRMSLCKGGVMVSLQAHAIISHCDINSVGYGIRCIQNARVSDCFVDEDYIFIQIYHGTKQLRFGLKCF